MKNFFKKIHFGAVAVLIGLGLILTQSAFKPSKTIDYWFTYNSGSGTYTYVSPENIPSNCDQETGAVVCAVGLSTANTDLSGPSPQPKASVIADQSTADQRLYELD